MLVKVATFWWNDVRREGTRRVTLSIVGQLFSRRLQFWEVAPRIHHISHGKCK